MTFSEVLRAAMKQHGHSFASLARASGVAESTIAYWLTGARMPTLQRADQLAELLDAPMLSRLTLDALARRCARCRRRYVADSRNSARTKYCGKTCRTAVARSRWNEKETAQRKRRNAKLERAVGAHCRWCEPAGICRDSECALRSVSPLPLIQLTRRAA